VPPRSRPFS